MADLPHARIPEGLDQVDASLFSMPVCPFSPLAKTARSLHGPGLRGSFGCRLHGVAAAMLAASTLAGCANPGSPRPPSLRLPRPADGLRAERVGTEVHLAWTTPDATTDGDHIRFPIIAAVCRITAEMPPAITRKNASPAPVAAPCTQIQRYKVLPGPAQLTDALPPELLTQPDRLLIYRVSLLNGSDRSAPAAETYAASGSTPAPVTGFRPEPRREGALLTWRPAAAPAGEPMARITVHRTRAADEAVHPAKQAPTRSGVKGVAQAGEKPGRPAEALLVADLAPGAPDPGGMIDRAVRDPKLEDVAWTYTAERVRTVQLGGHTLELHGLPSPAVPFTWHDVFAPSAPTGLATVPTLSPPSVDLSWEPAFDPGLVGYNVYRADGLAPEARFVRLTPQPVAAPSFRDLHVQPGRVYRYRVAAVGAHGLEGAPSVTVQESVR